MQVQALALEILVAYKLKFLLPYKDHLLRLIDEKQFKSELLAFPLGEETTDIKPEHRADLMPVLLRLLYGRMRAAKAGKKHGGRGAIQGRRALIMHHMLALPEQEVRYFFNLVFEDLFTGSVGLGTKHIFLQKMLVFWSVLLLGLPICIH
jgi:U3 small nucleolar RNA-associated protein 20